MSRRTNNDYGRYRDHDQKDSRWQQDRYSHNDRKRLTYIDKDNLRYRELNDRSDNRHVYLPREVKQTLEESSTNNNISQDEVKGNASITKTEIESKASTEDTSLDAKKQERLKKLEAWKKKQQERKKLQESEKEKVIKKEVPVKPKQLLKPSLTKLSSTKKGLRAPLKKSSLFSTFDDDENESSSVSLFKPNLHSDELQKGDSDDIDINEEPSESKSDNADDDTIDPLELFMSQLNDDNLPNQRQGDTINLEENDGDAQQDTDLKFTDDGEADLLLKKFKSKKTKDINIPKFNLKTMEKINKNLLVKSNFVDPDEAIDFRVINNIFINDKSISPILNFYHFGLDVDTLNILTSQLNFENPTPIQSQTIPAIMSGADVIGIGKTGSGKTMCYLLSMLKHIKQQRPLSDGETGPLGIILSPTRELAIQIYETCEIFLKSSNVRAISCTGGSDINKQISEIKKGVEIIVATPGRLIDLITLNNGKLLKTDRVSFVTLDEADRLFDLGFEPQINHIMKTIRPDKQCVLFSATFPTKLKNFAIKILHKPVIISVGNKQVVNEKITQKAQLFETEDEKFTYLLQLLGKQEGQKTILFCESQLQVNFMNRRLSEKGYKPVAIHAGLPANERTANLQSFRKIKGGILICTEVLSRGLDVPDVNLVILYNAARTFAQYVHSTGRTARGNNTGTAISLLSKGEELQSYILYKCMVEDEIPEDIKTLALNFEKDLKSGKKKITSGFGGKGLDNLERVRDEQEKIQRKQYGEDDADEEQNKKSNNSDDDDDDDNDNGETKETETVGPNLDIVFNTQDGRAPDSGIYNAKVNINDLPQNVRWLASNNTSLSKIIEETSTSITYRGKFYPEGQEPKEGEEPKLYLFVESQKEHQILEAIEAIKKVIITELKRAQNDRSGKFSL